MCINKQASSANPQIEAFMDIINLNANSVLQTNALAKALTESGYPTSPATLATKRSRGGGPPYRRWGRIPVYTWGDALKRAQSRLGEPRRSTSEEDAASTPPVKHFGAGDVSAAPAEQSVAAE
jgi:hypothetical protein